VPRSIIPLFPLGSVLYPGLALPLHIFEERYRLLVSRLSEGESDIERSFGVVAIRAGHEVGSASAHTLHEVGTAAVLRRVTPYPDGRSDILTAGSRRFRLVGVDASEPYLQGEVEWLEEVEGDPGEVAAAATRVAEGFRGYQRLLGGDDEPGDEPGDEAGDEPGDEAGDEATLPDDPAVLSYLVSAAMVLDLGDRQRLLAAPTVADRLDMLDRLLERELTAIRLLGAVPATDLLRSGVSLN
jgi:Lon protease-like protein